MSRSDTFDSDILEADTPARSLPWISAPVLQNTTCEALLDPRKLLCESSSIVALIPCRTFTSIKKNDNVSVKKESCSVDNKETSNRIAEISSCVSDPIENPVDDAEVAPVNVFQSDLLSEILSSANALQLLGNEVNIVSTDEIPINDASLNINTDISENSTTSSSENSVQEQKTQDTLPAWCFEGDDSFRDVIEAINRLCDTMSSVGSNNNTEDTANFATEQSASTEERITQQPKHYSPPFDVRQYSNQNDLPKNSVSISGTQNAPISVIESSGAAESAPVELSPINTESIDSSADPQTSESFSTLATAEDVVNVDSSAADSSSPAVIEDDSSTNHTDLLQYSMCSSSLMNEDSSLFLSTDSHLPNPEEVPPPGHVAAMRIKFETITNVNVSTMRLLKKSDDET